jgi:hypothetical protein
LVSEKAILSLSTTLQSSTSPQGRHESTSRYMDKMIENAFIQQKYVKNKCNRESKRYKIIKDKCNYRSFYSLAELKSILKSYLQF